MRLPLFVLAILILTSCQTKNTWKCEGNCDNGEGIKIWKDGGIEKGYWKDGQLIGHGYQFFGTTSEFSKDSYEGDFLNGYHGFGKYIDISEDAIHEGNFKNGKANGKGKLTFGENSKYPKCYYDGEWLNGKQHGYGIKFWGEAGRYTNNKYQGDWENDKMQGNGRYDWADGGYYIGEWYDSDQNGRGIYTFPNGEKFKGTWKKGYCPTLAVIIHGESAYTFRGFIVEIRDSTYLTSQPFIDVMVTTFKKLISNPKSNIDYKRLRALFETAKENNIIALSKLSRIQEYDSEIGYKSGFSDELLAFQQVLKEFNAWFEVMESENDFEKTQYINEKIVEKLTIMKQIQIKFEETKKKFRKKHLE